MSSKEETQALNTSEELTTTQEKRKSIVDIIREKQNDQDFNQKMNVFTTLILEIYRVLMGAFLVAFVPQKCGNDICSLSQNISRNDAVSQTAVGLNAFTMLSFLILYFVEVKRENKLITYLEVNRFTPVDNESVGTALENLATDKKQQIWNYDGYYQKAGYLSTFAFVINAGLSSYVVYSHYLDNKTVTVYLTNLLFMGLKVVDVFSTVNTKKNIFYSAYLKNKVQFNDVDPDKLIDNSNTSDHVEELKEDSDAISSNEVTADAV